MAFSESNVRCPGIPVGAAADDGYDESRSICDVRWIDVHTSQRRVRCAVRPPGSWRAHDVTSSRSGTTDVYIYVAEAFTMTDTVPGESVPNHKVKEKKEENGRKK